MTTKNIVSKPNSKSLCVVGYVYFETYVPSGGEAPVQGTEQFVPEITLSLGAAYTPAAVAQALGCHTILCYPEEMAS